jgi:hypothetical protein
MPVTAFGSSSLAARGPTPAAAPAAPPPVAAMPAGDGVGHGVTRLKAYTTTTPFIPGTPPPRGETAGAHGAHKGRISIR